jgi:hypothetical protein
LPKTQVKKFASLLLTPELDSLLHRKNLNFKVTGHRVCPDFNFITVVAFILLHGTYFFQSHWHRVCPDFNSITVAVLVLLHWLNFFSNFPAYKLCPSCSHEPKS